MRKCLGCGEMFPQKELVRVVKTKLKDAEGNEMKDAEGNPLYLTFRDVVNYFDEGDVFVFNDTKVFPARLYGTQQRSTLWALRS